MGPSRPQLPRTGLAPAIRVRAGRPCDSGQTKCRGDRDSRRRLESRLPPLTLQVARAASRRAGPAIRLHPDRRSPCLSGTKQAENSSGSRRDPPSRAHPAGLVTGPVIRADGPKPGWRSGPGSGPRSGPHREPGSTAGARPCRARVGPGRVGPGRAGQRFLSQSTSKSEWTLDRVLLHLPGPPNGSG